jgi:hypothetical protein|tara:strand:- start:206 stop:511 length:306 start_codon:yes stop_codon:yes gene_type:complete
MALKVDIPLQGGITHSDGYVRITNARVCRKDNEDSWFLMVDVSVYKDADERAKSAPKVIPCPSIDKFKYAYSMNDETDSNLIALAYTKLKTESVLDGASDV